MSISIHNKTNKYKKSQKMDDNIHKQQSKKILKDVNKIGNKIIFRGEEQP